MKRKITLLIMASLLALAGCSSDESSKNNTIEGKWHLMTIIGSDGEAVLELERGKSIWTFHEDISTLAIENEGPVNQMMPLGEGSGNYFFSVVEQEDGNHLIKEEYDYGLIIINGNTMKLDSGEDGSYNFKR